ncbi:MAG: hypothetical protein J6Y71_05420 [Ruminococcus sp.]|nr:hypothetical protein [Ruminococcus sp.]
MKKKTKKIIIAVVLTLILLLMGGAVYYFQFTGDGYLQSIPYRHGFQEIELNVYMNRENSLAPEEVTTITKQARDRVTEFFGEMRCLDSVTIIICDDEKISKKIGDKTTKTLAFPEKKDYISLSNEYCNVDVLAHEMTHAELHSHLSVDAQRNLPVWFDEGTATQNDYREKYSSENWAIKTDNGKNATPLDDMDTYKEFQCSDEQERQYHYICAKHELKEWIDSNSVQELIELVDNYNAGEDFYTLYCKKDKD